MNGYGDGDREMESEMQEIHEMIVTVTGGLIVAATAVGVPDALLLPLISTVTATESKLSF
jgi:hypothetical protein